MLQPINLPLETEGNVYSGQNNTCGRRGNELEGMLKMCSAVNSPLKWLGSSQNILLRCPLKHLRRREMAIFKLTQMSQLTVATG